MCLAILMTIVTSEGGSGGGSGGGGGPLTAVADPTFVEGFHYGYGTAQTFEPSVVSVSGGVPPFSYSWTRVSGSSLIHADNPTNASTTFSSLMTIGISRTATFKCTVTDSAGTPVSVDSNTVDVSLSSSADVGGGEIP